MLKFLTHALYGVIRKRKDPFLDIFENIGFTIFLVCELAKNCQIWAILSNILALEIHKISFRGVIHKRILAFSYNTIESMCEKF